MKWQQSTASYLRYVIYIFALVGLWVIPLHRAFILLLWAVVVAAAEFREHSFNQQLRQLHKQVKEAESSHDELVHNQLRLQGAAVLDERVRMAREVHDTVSRSLTAVIVTAEALERRLYRGANDVSAELNSIKEQARQGLKDVRHSLSKLRPTAETEEELHSSLRILADQIQRWYDIRVSVTVETKPHKVSDEHRPVLFRLIQEAATNAIRHGKASSLSVSLSDCTQGFMVIVKDNGTGCGNIKPGYGLIGMSERIQALGGQVKFVSAPTQGFEVIATFPMKEVEQDN